MLEKNVKIDFPHLHLIYLISKTYLRISFEITLSRFLLGLLDVIFDLTRYI